MTQLDCPKCGYKQAPEGAQFCPACGQMLQKTSERHNSSEVSVTQQVSSISGGKVTGVAIEKASGNVNIKSTVNQLEAKIFEQQYVDRQTITQNIIVLGPEALEQIAKKLAALQGLDKQPIQNISERPVPEHISRQITEIIAAQREAAVSGVPTTPQASYDLGMLAAYNREYDIALGYFRQAVLANPEFTDAYEAIAWLQQARADQYLAHRQYDQAIASLTQAREAAIHTDPLNPKALALRGYIAKTQAQVAEAQQQQTERERYYGEATRMFEQAAKLDPDDPSALNGLGNIQYAQGNLDGAIAAYSRVIELLPNYVAAHHDLALAYEGKWRADPEHAAKWRSKALEAWRRTYELAPQDPAFSADYIVTIGQRISGLETLTGLDSVKPGAEVTGVEARTEWQKVPGQQFRTGERPKSKGSAPSHNSTKKEKRVMAEKPLTYRDFTIEMADLKDDGTFKVRVIGQTPAGEMQSAEAETPKYKLDEFKLLLGKLERRRAVQQELIELGEKLADLLLPGLVRTLFNQSLKALKEDEGLRLRLRIEPLKLAALPWEYTYVQRTSGEKVPNDFLALHRKVSITRYETIGAALKPLDGKEKFRIVVALANPISESFINLPALDVEADRRAIMAAINDLNANTQAVEPIVLQPTTREGLLKAITGADIFHFSGHGIFEESEPTPEGKFRNRGKILLESRDATEDPFDSDQLAILLGNAGVRLVVLGACNSATRDEGGAWTGVAPALVRENIPAVVAMQYRVQDQNAARFIAFLYTRILGGYTIDEAVFEGRQALFTQSGLEDRDWGVPVLYLRAEDGFLFPVPSASAASQESPLVLVQRTLGAVRGTDIGAEVDEMISGRLEVRDHIDRVEEGGSTTGVKMKKLGGR